MRFEKIFRRSAMLLPLLVAVVLIACESHQVVALTPHDVSSRAGDVEPVGNYEEAYSSLLKEIVTAEGLVRYDLLRGPHNLEFRRILKAVEEFDASSLNTHEAKLAFWMNAYNIQMLQNIIETPEVDNIVEDGYVEAFFRTPFRTARRDITLDQIEHVILRGEPGPRELEAFRVEPFDPRIHVGINCAAISCPRLRMQAFTAENVDAELDAAMRDFAGSNRHFRVEDGRVVISSLLDWFGTDFDRSGEPAGSFILSYMPESRPGYDTLKAVLMGRSSQELKSLPNVSFEYLWDVNRAP